MDKQGPLPSLYLSIQNPTPMVKDLTTISERMYTQMVMKVTCPPLPASQPSDFLVSNKNPCDNSLWHPDKNAENVGEFSETNIQQTTEDSSGRKYSRGRFSCWQRLRKFGTRINQEQDPHHVEEDAHSCGYNKLVGCCCDRRMHWGLLHPTSNWIWSCVSSLSAEFREII